MRLAGWTIRSGQLRSNPGLDYAPDEFRIIALGESTTAQTWVDGRPDSWVDQLQTNLNAAGLGRRFKIVNLAVAGTSTPFLLNDLDDSFQRIKPHAVISMMGINDQNSLEYLRSSPLRIVKLWGWLRSAFDSPQAPPSVSETDMLLINQELLAAPWAKASRREDLAAVSDFVETVAVRHREQRWLVYLWVSHTLHQRYIELWEEKRAPVSQEVMSALLESCRFYARLSHELNPRHMRSLLYLLYCSAPRPDEHEAARRTLKRSLASGAELGGAILSKLDTIGGLRDPSLLLALERHGLRYIPSRSFLQGTQDSYRLLADRLKSRGVPFLAMQYPTGNPDAIRNYFALNPRSDFKSHRDALYGRFPGLKVMPRYADVLVISNENFNDIVTAANFSRYFTDRFAGRFGHMTREGNALVARNAADFIIAHWADISARAPR